MSSILKFIRDNHILAIIESTVVKKKSRLNLNAYEITEIPGLLYTCYDVEHLYLHRNQITMISVELTQLVNLTTLTLDYNNISSLPPEIGNLKNLVNLNLSYNPLNVLIPEIGELENLEAFWCNRIGLREIPVEIGKLSKLDTFGARGNKLKTIPEEMTKLSKLRWLTLERNEIETLPNTLCDMEGLIHCNLRDNCLTEFPVSVLRCRDLMYLHLNNNQISSVPEDFDINSLHLLEMIDLRDNPICELDHPKHMLIRYSDDASPGSLSEAASQSSGRHAAALALNATALRLPAVPAPRHLDHAMAMDGVFPAEMELDASSVDSEDWENSVTSSELDVQYQDEEDRPDNEAVGMVFPELSRYASTAS